MIIGQDMRSTGTVRPARHGQNAFMELAITREGGVFGGLVVSDIHVARKRNTHWIVSAPARRALGLEQGNALANYIERCELVEEQIVAALGHAANGRVAPGAHPEWRGGVLFCLGRGSSVVQPPTATAMRRTLPPYP